jgi:hypothetical protein
MLKFEGIKEFDIEKLDNNSILARNFQIVFSDDFLNEEDCEEVEKSLKKHKFKIKNEIIKLEVIYNIDLDTATITMNIFCPLTYSEQILEEKLLKFVDRHRINFEDYYKEISPY